MAESGAAVTILIPHYQTLEAIRLCLRSIRCHTAPPYRVVVLDNGSTDASIDYVRGLGWVTCVSTNVPNDLVSAQAAALNVGAERVQTPYFLVIHSDTFVHRGGWLTFLVERLRAGGYAAVGTRHQTIRAYDSAVLAGVADRAAGLIARVARREAAAGVPWLRSCLALYRTDVFRAVGGRFASDGKEDATHAANATLAAHGHRLLALPDRVVGYYVFHKGDTTRIANRLYAADDPEFRARMARHQRHVGGFRARADHASDPRRRIARPLMAEDAPRLRILHVDAERDFSGGEVQVFLLIDGLAARGHANVLLCPPGSRAEAEAARRGLAVRTVPMRGDLDLVAVWRLSRAHPRRAPSISSTCTPAAPPGSGDSRHGWPAVPAIVTRRMDRPVRPGWRTRLIYERVTGRTVAISPGVADRLSAGGVPPARVTLIPSAVDPTRLRPRRARAAVRAAEVRRRRTSSCWRWRHWCRARGSTCCSTPSPRWRPRRLRPWLWIAGEGPERPALAAQVAALGLQGQVALARPARRRGRSARGLRRLRPALAPRGPRRRRARGHGRRAAGRGERRRRARRRRSSTAAPACSCRPRIPARWRTPSNACCATRPCAPRSAPPARSGSPSASAPSTWSPPTNGSTGRYSTADPGVKGSASIRADPIP